jgi:hypothetical protein
VSTFFSLPQFVAIVESIERANPACHLLELLVRLVRLDHKSYQETFQSFHLTVSRRGDLQMGGRRAEVRGANFLIAA